MNVTEFCKALPKLELHAHMNGSISDSTMSTLLDRYRRSHASGGTAADEWSAVIAKGHSRTLTECFVLFKIIHEIVCDEEAVRIVARDVVCEFAADGVIYLELRTTPRDNPATGMTKRKYIDAVLEGVSSAVADCGSSIHVRLLLSVDRGRSVADALETVELAKQYSNSGRVVGIDLSGNPQIGDVSPLLPVLKSAKDCGLKLSLHLSEIPNTNVETSLLLSVLPDRIGHGTFLVPSLGGDTDNVDLITKHRIPIELCLTSNVKCETVVNYDQHQLGFWLNNHKAHPIVICTDDKGVFSTTLSQEYEIAAQTFGLSTAALKKLSLQAVDYIFDESIRTELKQSLQC